MDYNNGRSYDSGNGNFPYRGKPPEYGYSDNINGFFSKSDNKEILIISAAFGLALILHILLKYLYSFLLTLNKDIYALYNGNEVFTLVAEMLYSLVCVGIPFLVAYLFLISKDFTCKPIPFRKSKSLYETFFLIVSGVGLCMAGNILTSLITSYAAAFGIGFRSYDLISQMSSSAPDSPLLLILTLIHTAILPAFIEEIAIRGCLMQPLRKFGDLFAIFTSAFIFGILHGNLTQAPFAFIAGLILGFVCIQTGSMWPNIIIHFLNNAVSVLESVAIDKAGDEQSYAIAGVIIYGLIFLGAIALFGYLFLKKSIPSIYKPMKSYYRDAILLFYFCPSTLIALLYFLFELYSDIYIK